MIWEMESEKWMLLTPLLWKIQAFTKAFRDCNHQSSLKLAFLSIVEEIMIPVSFYYCSSFAETFMFGASSLHKIKHFQFEVFWVNSCIHIVHSNRLTSTEHENWSSFVVDLFCWQSHRFCFLRPVAGTKHDIVRCEWSRIVGPSDCLGKRASYIANHAGWKTSVGYPGTS